MSTVSNSRQLGSLGRKAGRGVLWLFLQTFAVKAIQCVGQLVLAHFLVPEDFGLVGLTTTVMAFVAIIKEPGLRIVLIQRQKRFDRWSNAAIWMTAASGILGMLLTCLLAPVAARLYNEPKLIGLFYVLAVSIPLGTLGVVPRAKLESLLDFRWLAVMGMAQSILTLGISILCAWQGLGAYSFVIPTVIVNLLTTVMYTLRAKVTVLPNPQFRRWRWLIWDSGVVVLTNFFLTLTWVGDYIILGYVHDKYVVGIYYFAFLLSIQSVHFVSQGIGQVLFPTLSKIQDDPERQGTMFLTSLTFLGLIGIPICFIQAAVADPFIRTFCQPKYIPSIPVLQVLSLGMSWRLLGSPSISLIQSQRRFSTLLVLSVCYATVFLSSVWIGASHGGAWGAGVAASIYFAAIGPINVATAVATRGIRYGEIARIFLVPSSLAGISVGIAILIGRVSPGIQGGAVTQMIFIPVVTLATYSVLVWFLLPDRVSELRQRVESLVSR